ncbi:MAG: hypothetical protein LBG60_15200 [Bifidobacteriaceae bacterium]|jgi:hypothetical protein|nr:hypothetical protein [Bifidobacteriaceae bacterium]
MTLAELISVIAIGSIVLGLIGTLTVSMMKHDGINLVRQSRVDGVRQISIWLGDALTYASPDAPENPGDTLGNVFAQADADKMVFTAALPIEGHADDRAVSRVTITLGEDCRGVSIDQEGLLYRCVQTPLFQTGQPPTLCVRDAPGCPEALFEDLLVARGVKDGPLFSYFLTDSNGVLQPTPHAMVSGAGLGLIGAVEMLVTVAGETDDDYGQDIEATVFKRFTINQWRKL